MNETVRHMIEGRPMDSEKEMRNSLREVLQEIAIYGLSEAGFFKDCAFYGGTALRLFYGLDRYSEDLDFSLRAPVEGYDLHRFMEPLTETFKGLGISADIKVKDKSFKSKMESAFVKSNTKTLLLDIAPDDVVSRIYCTDTIKVKMELDTDPPGGAVFEKKARYKPYPHNVCLFDESSLFAGKVHAILCRNWGNRFKGRDLYDLVFYVSNDVPLNLDSLKARLVQTCTVEEDEPLDIGMVRTMLIDKMAEIDFETAKEDVVPFVKDTRSMKIWGREFFIDTVNHIR